MVNTERNTIYSSSEGNIWHYALGQYLAATDIDLIEYYKDDPIAVIDYKYGGDGVDISENYGYHCAGIKKYRKLAAKLEVPFYIMITFLNKEVPMFYVVPCNDLAKAQLINRVWQTPLQMSKWLHKIRGMHWNGGEEISIKNRAATGITGLCLRDLPNEYAEYTLQKVDVK